ncbi:MAG: conjugal transfer protein, partial [Actinomycetota bacterium]|nr:conjugal transfer protein [Actinomycetota bacterium]
MDRPRWLDQAWAPSPKTRARLGTCVLWVLLGLAALGGIGVLVPNAPMSAKAATDGPRPSVGPQGWAEMYVATWLATTTATNDELRRFFPAAPAVSDPREGGRYAAQRTALAASEEPPGSGYWSVLVAVDVVTVSPGGWHPDGTHFFQVPAKEVPGGYVATALPAEVAGPATGEAPRLTAGLFAPPMPNDPMSTSVQRSLDALLVGRGELARYTAPGTELRPVAPPAFAAVELTGVARITDPEAEGPVVVSAEVVGTRADGRRQRLQYTLE